MKPVVLVAAALAAAIILTASLLIAATVRGAGSPVSMRPAAPWPVDNVIAA
jgi:hypothetical protein